VNAIERKLQVLNKLQTWANTNGFKFSQDKIRVIRSCRKHKLHLDPVLFLNNQQLTVASEVKFLGIIFDRKLSFLPHIKYLKSKCLKSLNLLQVIVHNNWGADQCTLFTLYHFIIRSKLDYGSIIYNSASVSYVQQLNPVTTSALRLCL